MDLNVEPFTVEGIARKEAESDIRKSNALRASSSIHDPKPPEYYQYQLSGVVVHTGTADGGHYYSFIKERVPLQGETRKWFEFNDSCVELWDINELKKECFGGKQTITQRDRQTGQIVTMERDILKNAYILVYERITKAELENHDEELIKSNSMQIPKSPKSPRSPKSPKNEEKQENVTDDEEEFKNMAQVPIPEDIMKKIWKENREFIVEKHVFDKNFFNFIWRLINLYTTPEHLQNPNETVMKAVELATRFVIEIYARSRENQLFPMWIDHLSNIYGSYVLACQWLFSTLITKIPLIKTILFYCPMEKSRIGFATLINESFKTLKNHERENYCIQYENIKNLQKLSDIKSNEIKSYSIVLIETLLFLMKDARNPKNPNTQFFLVFQNFMKIGHDEFLYLNQRNFLITIIHFILGTDLFSDQNKLDLMNTKESVSFFYLVGLVFFIYLFCFCM